MGEWLRALVVVLAVLGVSSGAHAQAKKKQPAGANGRWKIVNPTPSAGVYNVMLIDTASGSTWVICKVPNYEHAWCEMPKTEDLSSAQLGFVEPANSAPTKLTMAQEARAKELELKILELEAAEAKAKASN